MSKLLILLFWTWKKLPKVKFENANGKSNSGFLFTVSSDYNSIVDSSRVISILYLYYTAKSFIIMAHRAQLLWDHPENKEKNSLSFQTQHSIWVTYVSELLMIMLTQKYGRTDGNKQHFYVPLH